MRCSNCITYVDSFRPHTDPVSSHRSSSHVKCEELRHRKAQEFARVLQLANMEQTGSQENGI